MQIRVGTEAVNPDPEPKTEDTAAIKRRSVLVRFLARGWLPVPAVIAKDAREQASLKATTTPTRHQHVARRFSCAPRVARFVACALASCAIMAPLPAQPVPNGNGNGDGNTTVDEAAHLNDVAPDAPPTVEEVTVRFNFKGVAYSEVIDFFSRATGLSVIYEVAPPEGMLTFFAPEPYDLNEGLRVLNVILQAKQVTLRRDREFLYLGKFDKTTATPTYVQGQIPGDVTDDQLVTVLIPLDNIIATEVTERLAPLVGAYGGMSPIPQQNSVLLTETAGQCRRLQEIIGALDAAGDYQDQVRIFAMRHAQAKTLLETLKVLMSERVVKYVINQQGQQVKLEEDDLAGLRLEADERTNVIIAKGPESRLEMADDMIALLDVPTTAQGGEMTTVNLGRITSDEAAKLVKDLFAGLPAEEQPRVVPLVDVNKLTIIGATAAIAQAVSVLDEVDGGGDDPANFSRTTQVVSLSHASASDVQSALKSLLTPRQSRLVRTLESPDGQSLILAGPSGDVNAVSEMISTLDLAPAQRPKEIRIVRLTSGDVDDLLRRVTSLYERQSNPNDPTQTIEVEQDPESNTLTLIGERAAVERWQSLLATVQSTVQIERETRQFTISNATPTRVTSSLSRLSAQLLKPLDANDAYVAPAFSAVDEMDLVLASATPDQWSVIEALIETLDEPEPRNAQFRVVPVRRMDPRALADRATERYEVQVRDLDPTVYGPVTVEVDRASGSLLLTATSQALSTYTDILTQLQQLVPPDRTTEFIAMQAARSEDIVDQLNAMLQSADPIDPSRDIEAPSLLAMQQPNGLLVTAEAAQHRTVRDFVKRLDLSEPGDLSPMRLLQLRTADATNIAGLLSRQYESRPADQRRDKPVEIQADAATNTLIVSAHEDLFDDIRSFVDQLNETSAQNADRVTEIFPLKIARAEDLANAMERLYPDPPMPYDRRGAPMPWAQEPREVQISADPASNSIIVDAPSERIPAFKALVERLDRIDVSAAAEIRTYPIRRADINTVERTLNQLATAGMLAGPAQPGIQRIKVSVTAEPVSGTLIVTGDETTFAKVEQLLESLQEIPVERQLRVIQVANADPQELADRANAIYAEQTGSFPDVQPVDVQIDAATNSLFVIGEAEASARFVGIVNQLQESIGPNREVQLVALEHADATDVAAVLADLAGSSRSFQATAPGAVPVFEVIERTNSILVAAQPVQHAIINGLIRELDVIETDELPPVRILSLETADAAALALTLSRVYDSRSNDQRMLQPVRITADANTNTLLVSAHPEPFDAIRRIVEDLNDTRARGQSDREIRIFPLTVARAAELAETLDQMFPEPPLPVDSRGRPLSHLRRPREVVVRGDAQTNSIIVDAPVARMAGFEELVRQLDTTEMPADGEVRTYRIVHADLSAVRNAFEDLVSSGALLGGDPNRRRSMGVTIGTEPVSQTLIVAGPIEIFDEVERVLADLDAQTVRPPTVLRFFRLEHARADSLVPLLRQLLVARLNEDVDTSAFADVASLLEVTAEPKTNTLIINAPESIMSVAEQLIEQLDDSTAQLNDPLIRIVPLTFADASSIASTLNETLPQIISKTTREPIRVNIIASPGSNALVMVGVEADLAEVESLVESLDSRPSLDTIVAETFALQYADAPSIADVVESLLSDHQELDPRLQLSLLRSRRIQPTETAPKIRVVADERTNSLIVSAPQQTLALAGTLIAELDAPSSSEQRVVELFTPLNASADRLASLVSPFFTGESVRQRVDLIADAAAGVIVVKAPGDRLDEVLLRLAEMDSMTPVPPAMDIQLIAMTYADAAQMAPMLSTMLQDQARWPERLRLAIRAGIDVAQPNVAADAGSNRLIISAPQEIMNLARELIAQLDQPVKDPESAAELRIFNLTTADATSVATSLQAAMQQWTARQGVGAAATSLSISADESTNSLIAVAPPDAMVEIGRIVGDLDQGSASDQAQVRTVYLKHARAEQIAPVIEKLLVAEEIDSWLYFDLLRRGRMEEDNSPDVRVAAEPRLNAVVISAAPSVLNVAEEMVRQLDVDPLTINDANRRSVRVIALRNSDAATISESLSAVLDDTESGEAPPTIRVDAPSNSLIVRATQSQFATIDLLVDQLEDATLTSSRQIQMIPVDRSRASARSTAETIQRLLEQRGGMKVEIISVDELIRREAGSETPLPPTSPPDVEQSWLRRRVPARIRLLTDISWSPVAAIAFAAIEPDAFPDSPFKRRFSRGNETAERVRPAQESATEGEVLETTESASVDATAEVDALHATAETHVVEHDVVDVPSVSSIVHALPLVERVWRTTFSIYPSQTIESIGRELVEDIEASKFVRSVFAQPSRDLVLASEAANVGSTDNEDKTWSHLASGLDHEAGSDTERESDALDALMASATTIHETVAVQPEETRDAEDEPVITIAIDEATNSLIVIGSPYATQQLATLVAEIEAQIPPLPGQIRYIPLNGTTDATQLATLLNSTLSEVEKTPGGLTGSVAVLADPEGDGLIVSANDIDFDMVGSLIAAISRQADGDAYVMKVYAMNSEVEAMGGISLLDLMPDEMQSRRRGSARSRRAREILLKTQDEAGNTIESLVDPTRINFLPNSNNDTMIVVAPEKAIPLIDRFIAIVDQVPAENAIALRQFVLQNASAETVSETVSSVLSARFEAARMRSGRGVKLVRPAVSADERTNSLIVTGTVQHFEDVETLLAALDAPTADERFPLAVIDVPGSLPSRLKVIIDEIVIGNDPGRREEVVVVPEDAAQVLLVRAPEVVVEQIRTIVTEIEQAEADKLPIRAIKLARADADRAAQALQRFFEDRAKLSVRPGQEQPQRRVSIIGDKRSSTVFVAANDEDFAEIESLVAMFDAPSESEDLRFELIPIKHAKARDVADIVDGMTWRLTYDPNAGRWGGQSYDRGRIGVDADERTNTIIVTGTGENFELVHQIVRALDVPTEHRLAREVTVISIEYGDTALIARAIEDAFDISSQPEWWYWDDSSDPDELKVFADRQNKLLIVSGDAAQIANVEAFVETLEAAAKRPDQELEVIALANARAEEVSRNLSQFFQQQARAARLPDPALTITAAPSANRLVVSATPDQLQTIRDLLVHLDVPAEGDSRRIELMVLNHGQADEAADTIRDLFPARNSPPDQRILVTADPRTNSLVISAPDERFAELQGVISMVDAPPAGETRVIHTFTLSNTRAFDVADILTDTLNLDQPTDREGAGELRGQVTKYILETEIGNGAAAEPIEVSAEITPSSRSNALIVVATPESMPLIAQLIETLDRAPAVSERDYRVVELRHAVATDVRLTLSSLLARRASAAGSSRDEQPPSIASSTRENTLIIGATADQHAEITEILKQLDVETRIARTTEFVPLEFAEAEKVADALSVFYGRFALEADTPGKKNVTIVPDPATNSLVVSAEDGEWPGIIELLKKLDAEEYDSSLQLEVIALRYAQSNSVADALNKAFAPLVQGNQQNGNQNNGRRGGGNEGGEGGNQPVEPRILVEDTDVVRAAAEPLTNALIVSASRRNLKKVHSIVEQLDVADYAQLPPVRLIPLKEGKATNLAPTLQAMYAATNASAGTPRGQRQTVLIIADDDSNTIIVRAEEEEFLQIESIARSLETTSTSEGVTVRVLPVQEATATRVAAAVRDAFVATAREMEEPLSIEVDASANSLVVASTARMFEQIEKVVLELDQLAPGGGRQIFVVPVEHISPEEMKRVLETLGLDQPAREEGKTGVLSEPIQITTLSGHRSLAILANPGDRERLIAMVASLDVEPGIAEAAVRIVELKRSESEAVASAMQDMLNPADQHAQTAMAAAVKEQVRRLRLLRASENGPELSIDLTQPIRVRPAPTMNAVVISSTEANVDALVEIAKMFDTLPMTEAVTVRLFPLSNISAAMMRNIVDDLFTQGRSLSVQPGTNIQGQPDSEIGHALMDPVAMTVDERTNTLIVAGREQSVAFVDVMVGRLDTDTAAKWVEPRVMQLRHADATELAETLNEVLVDGQANGDFAAALQRQVGRLRVVRENGNLQNPPRIVSSDFFVPMSRLLIRPDAQLNALIAVGTPENLGVISELVMMLDIPAAAPENAVRIYALDHASAARVASIAANLFEQQARSGAIRDEDRLVVETDDRTNSLIVTTSPKSFAVLENLLALLDAEGDGIMQDIRMVPLTNASATLTARTVQELMDARADRIRATSPQQAELERVSVIPDTRTNSLLVSAAPDTFTVVEEVARSLDEGRRGETSSVRIIPLTRAVAGKVAGTLDEIFSRQYADLPDNLADREKPLILTDARTNSILVSAKPEDFERVSDLVKQLEAAPVNPAVGLHVLTLDSNSAEKLAPRLQQLMRERERAAEDGGDTTRDRTTIQADPVSNSLIVAASEENLTILQSLIDTLDWAEELSSADHVVEVFPLKNSQAPRLLDLLDDLYVREANRDRGEGTVRLSADSRLNAIVASAPEEDLSRIRDLINELESARVTDVREIEIVPLKAANSAETVSLIENVFRGGTRRTTETQSTILRFMRERTAEELAAETGETPTETEINTAIREAIRLTPDLRTNSIIVSAPMSSMRMIKEMIGELDSADLGSKRVKIFELVNADALQMAEMLRDLFNLEQSGTRYVLRPRSDIAGDEGMQPGNFPPQQPLPPDSRVAASFGDTDLITVPDERQALSITIDQRTNSLLVSGTQTYLDLVEEVIVELDAKSGTQRQELVYALRNARAAEVALALETFLTQEQDRILRTLGPDRAGSLIQQLEREVSVVGVEESNTLLISASPRYIDKINGLIEELDRAPAQVLISVMLAEVTLDADDQWGMDIDAGPFGANDLTASSSFGLGGAGVSGLGIPNLSVSTDDFGLLIRALQAQGRLEVLSQPQIVVSNNQAANFQVGQEIGIVTDVERTDRGPLANIDRQDIGIILEVTPSINPDGFVRMLVRPEISSLSARTTQVSEDFEAPIIDRREVNTTVTVKDGQTVVIGGLISNRSEMRNQHVPFLSEIPLFGEVFKTRLYRREKTELLVVITPHIINSSEDAERYTNMEIDALTLPEATKDQLRNGRMDEVDWDPRRPWARPQNGGE